MIENSFKKDLQNIKNEQYINFRDLISNQSKIIYINNAEIEIMGFKWGKSCNLMVACKSKIENIEFAFSVFSNNGYMSNDKNFNFKEYKEKVFNENNCELIVKFERSKKGFLYCKTAKLKKQMGG